MFRQAVKRVTIVTLVVALVCAAAACANASIITSYAWPPAGEDLFIGDVRLCRVAVGTGTSFLEDIIYGFIDIAQVDINSGGMPQNLDGDDKIAFLFSAQVKAFADGRWTLGAITESYYAQYQLYNLVDPDFKPLLSSSTLLLALSAVTDDDPYDDYLNTPVLPGPFPAPPAPNPIPAAPGSGLRKFEDSTWSFEFDARDVLAGDFFESALYGSMITLAAGLSEVADLYGPTTTFVPVSAEDFATPDPGTSEVDVRVFNFAATPYTSTSGWTHRGSDAAVAFNIVPEPSGLLVWSSLLACMGVSVLFRRNRTSRLAAV